MPIPLLAPPREQSSNNFQLVPSPGPRAPGSLLPRALAYGFDLLLLSGLSIYIAKIFSLLVVSTHMPAIHETGKMARRLFQDAFSTGQFQLGLCTFTLLYLAYFVALPRWMGKTLGMGLMGLRLEGFFAQQPSFRGLFLRQLGCFFQFFTGGLMLLPLLKGTNPLLVQDRMSGTRVVSDR